MKKTGCPEEGLMKRTTWQKPLPRFGLSQALQAEKQGAMWQPWPLPCFHQAQEMVAAWWVHVWCLWPCSASAPPVGCAQCCFLLDYQRQGVLVRECPYVTTGTPMTLKYSSDKCHHHHCQGGDTCRRGLADLPHWRGALEETCGGPDETWEKPLTICHSSETSLLGELRENSFKIFVTDHQKAAQTFLHWYGKGKYKPQWLSSYFSLCHPNETTKNTCPTEQLLT